MKENKGISGSIGGFVLSACADPGLLRTDGNALRAAGISNIRNRLSGRSALELSRQSRPGLVICDLDLGDMRAPQFIRALREQPSPPPVLAVSADRSRATMLDCVGAGCAGYLLRPYSLEGFGRQLAAARGGVELKERAKAHIEKLQGQEEQEKSIQRAVVENNPEYHYRRGLQYLASKRWDDAILAFTRAVTLQEFFAEAYVGLARAWKAKGRPDKYSAFMTKAAQAYARLERFHEARELFAGVLRDNPEAENPYLELGFMMMRRGEFEAAARYYHQAEAFKPGTDIYRELARACHFTEDPPRAARLVSDTLAELPGRPPASGAYDRIMGGPARAPREPGFEPPAQRFRAPGRLRELWLVMKFTWQIFREGGEMAVDG